MPDPFASPEMRERAAKLLRLLASDAVGEAEAARGALLRLLARHGATPDDLARRLLDQPDEPGLRAVAAAAERRAMVAEARSWAARAEARRLRVAAGRLRLACAAVGGLAALLVALAWLPKLGESEPPPRLAAARPEPPPMPLEPPPRPPQPPVGPAPVVSLGSLSTAMPEPSRPPMPAVRRGRVLPAEGVLLRLDPVPGVPSVALLPRGTEVVIDQAFPMLGTDWMQVRSSMGAGFVPASTIGSE